MRPQRSGFTLLELVTAIAVLMLLTALALPQVNQSQLKSKKAEVALVVDGLATALIAWSNTEAAYEPYNVGEHPRPVNTIDKTAVAWGTPPAPIGEWGFAPDGMVRGSYLALKSVNADNFIRGHSDVDNDDTVYRLQYRVHKTAETILESELCQPAATECF